MALVCHLPFLMPTKEILNHRFCEWVPRKTGPCFPSSKIMSSEELECTWNRYQGWPYLYFRPLVGEETWSRLYMGSDT